MTDSLIYVCWGEVEANKLTREEGASIFLDVHNFLPEGQVPDLHPRATTDHHHNYRSMTWFEYNQS